MVLSNSGGAAREKWLPCGSQPKHEIDNRVCSDTASPIGCARSRIRHNGMTGLKSTISSRSRRLVCLVDRGGAKRCGVLAEFSRPYRSIWTKQGVRASSVMMGIDPQIDPYR